MAIHEIPRAFRYVCDRCDEEHTQHNANGHYTNSLPPSWSDLRHHIRGPVTDDMTFTFNDWLLCTRCTQISYDVLKAFMESEISPRKNAK